MVIGGHAVAAWVARVDQEAVRHTQDLGFLVRRQDFLRVDKPLASVGVIHQNNNGDGLFLDGPEGSVRSAIHNVFAGEKVKTEDLASTPAVTASAEGPEFRVPTLDALVRRKLTSFRWQDLVHWQDLLEVGWMDESWMAGLAPGLATRLQEVVEARNQEA